MDIKQENPEPPKPAQNTTKVTAKDIYGLLAQRYSSNREWAIAGEVQRTTGWSDRRYDFVAMNCFASNNYKIEVVEIKISKSDLRHELEEPEKHNVIFEDIDYYSLAAPAEIIDMSIIPPKWGVYAVKDGKMITKRKPLALHDEADRKIKRSFAASFLRAAISQNLEKQVLSDQLREEYQKGYARGKQDCSWGQRNQELLERMQNERNEYMQILGDIGFPVWWQDQMRRDGKEQIEHLKACRDIVEGLDVEKMKFPLSAFEKKVQAMKAALDKLRMLKDGDNPTPSPIERMQTS